MDKRMLQTYSVWAKENLEKQIEVSLKTLGINSETDIKSARHVGDFTVIEGDAKSYPYELYEYRQFIADLVKSNGYKNFIEEIAYTWFNRLVALRFMEVHDFLPHGFRVLSGRSGDVEPEILKNLGFVKSELGLNMDTVGKFRDAGNIEGLFRYVLLRQCAALADILPMLFSKESDYLSLLLPQTLLTGDTVLTRLLVIPEEDFLNDVEIIGWMYQFYVSDKRQEYRNATLVTKELIPTLTQIFTTDWIVRYMAENSVGRIWLESYPNSPLRAEMKYYVDDAEQTAEAQQKIDAVKYRNVNPEDIRIIEPCCGSGHILVYVFDLLYRMYEEKGYQKREIPTLILSKNLVGLDVDKRAAQLASFSLAMKARSVNNRFFDKTYYVAPRVYEIIDSHRVEKLPYQRFLSDAHLLTDKEMADFKYLVETFRCGKTVGSLLKVKSLDFMYLREKLETIDRTHIQDVFGTAFQSVIIPEMKRLLSLAEIMSNQYDVMITNPPYLSISRFEDESKNYLNTQYPNSRTDMFAMFMEVPFVKKLGFRSIVNADSWMFLSSYSELRKALIADESIICLAHLGTGVFDAVVSTVVSTFRSVPGLYGSFQRLVESTNKEEDCTERKHSYTRRLMDFDSIPGNPFSYWISSRTLRTFSFNDTLATVAPPKQGMATADNDRFLRLWFEVNNNRVNYSAHSHKEAKESKKKWFPYNKGGSFRRWYGNREYLVNWENDGKEIKNNYDDNGKLRSRPQNLQYSFLPALTWSDFTSALFSVRYCEGGALFDIKGSSGFPKKNLFYILGLMNTKVIQEFIKIFNPTASTQVGDLSRIPVSMDVKELAQIENIARENYIICKNDWDFFETSWDFKRHPLVFDLRMKAEYRNSQWAEDRISKCSSLAWLYENWEKECQYRFDQLKANEEELNRIFIDIYGLQDELTPEVEDKDVTVRLADKERDVKSLISYLIGVIMGRYSLDVDGLAYAGGAWDASKYRTYQPDDDGIVPIYDGIGMQDGLTAKICELLKVIYGERFYKANIDFIADALGKAQNESSEETLNRYLNNGFYTDHLKTYQKRPIYWMLSSGKNSGFKCLLYMHRYNADTLARINGKYFLPESTRLKNELDELQIRIRDAEGREKIRLEKTRQKVAAAYNEAIEYGQALDHMANQYIAIDLDDGVKVNYAKFQGVEMVTDSGTKVKKDLLVPIK